VYEFFLGAFCIAVSYIDAGYSLPVRNGSEAIITRTLPALDLSRANIHAVKSIRDHLLRREFMRWHPDKLSRWLQGEGRDVIGYDKRLRVTEKDIAASVDQAVRRLKSECDDRLKSGVPYHRRPV
jgi:hypothetical protein